MTSYLQIFFCARLLPNVSFPEIDVYGEGMRGRRSKIVFLISKKKFSGGVVQVNNSQNYLSCFSTSKKNCDTYRMIHIFHLLFKKHFFFCLFDKSLHTTCPLLFLRKSFNLLFIDVLISKRT